MDVEWISRRFDVRRTRVQIVHRARVSHFPLAPDFFGKYIVSDIFIHGVASLTLAHMKRLAEAGAA